MKHILFKIMILVAAIVLPMSVAQAAVETGDDAPNFTGKTIDNEMVSLSDYKGKTVVLEWTNHQCPYVIKHYDSGNMQALQKEATEDGVVWLSIVSSAPGMQGHTTNKEAQMIIDQEGSYATERIMDASGEIGKAYGAMTTPHMFVIDEDGELVYQGAIDNNPSARQSTIDGATNYVREALVNLKDGKKIETTDTKPYGCSVKYKL